VTSHKIQVNQCKLIGNHLFIRIMIIMWSKGCRGHRCRWTFLMLPLVLWLCSWQGSDYYKWWIW